jgi:hypothetical protein
VSQACSRLTRSSAHSIHYDAVIVREFGASL